MSRGKKAPAGKVNAALEEALADEIKEISRKGDDGKYVYSVIDRTRVYNQALKLEGIKAKLPDQDFGKEFK